MVPAMLSTSALANVYVKISLWHQAAKVFVFAARKFLVHGIRCVSQATPEKACLAALYCPHSVSTCVNACSSIQFTAGTAIEKRFGEIASQPARQAAALLAGQLASKLGTPVQLTGQLGSLAGAAKAKLSRVAIRSCAFHLDARI